MFLFAQQKSSKKHFFREQKEGKICTIVLLQKTSVESFFSFILVSSPFSFVFMKVKKKIKEKKKKAKF
jgi:hypothetical protein